MSGPPAEGPVRPDIVAFLRARLDEDEAIARKATGEQWSVDGGSIIYGHALDQVVDYVYDLVSARHIARHDPARVLREVEAKRRIISEPGFLNDLRASEDRIEGEWGTSSSAYDDPSRLSVELLRLLALPYSDHPDYREEWRP